MCLANRLLLSERSHFGAPIGRAGLGRLSVLKVEFDIIVERALVAFARKNIIGFLLENHSGNSIDRHDRALARQHLQKLGDRLDLLLLQSTARCPMTRPASQA